MTVAMSAQIGESGPGSAHRVVSALGRARIAARRSKARAARRRRRLLAAAAALGALLAVGHAGTALGGSSLATPGRGPQAEAIVTRVVERGDTLWSIAEEIAPERDTRAVVDELVRANGGSDLVPGESISWMRR